MSIIDQVYVHGSMGWKNLFFRPKGTIYYSKPYEDDMEAEEDLYIIQWEGNPEYDSGYHSLEFYNIEDAIEAFEKIAQKHCK